MGNRNAALASSVDVVVVLRRGVPDPCMGLEHFHEGKFVFVLQAERHFENSSWLLIG